MEQISFIINTGVNTLDYVKVLLNSLKENLVGKEHEILIFIDTDNEGTYDYLKSIRGDFHDMNIIRHNLHQVGYALNSNILVKYAKHNIISYLQSDMVISPNYDVDILSELEPNCILSSTRIEPPLHGESPTTITYNFGTDPNKFDITSFNKYAVTVKSNKTLNYFFAPYTFYRDVWISVGGYDPQFRRSREDSDFVQRCMHNNIKLKQTFKANVYHFTCVSSRGKDWFDKNNKEAQRRVEMQKLADNIELTRFFRKWGGFNHGQTPLIKYDVDLVINSTTVDYKSIINVEPFVSRVWCNDSTIINTLISFYGGEHKLANELFGFTNEEWERSKNFYKSVDFTNIYNEGEPPSFNVKIVWNGISNTLPRIVGQLHELIKQYDVGTYEYDDLTITIENKVNISPVSIDMNVLPDKYLIFDK